MILTKCALAFLATIVAGMPNPQPDLRDFDTSNLHNHNESERMPLKHDSGRHFEWLDHIRTGSKTHDLAQSRPEGLEHSNIKRKDPVYGIFECAQPDFQGICKWTQIFLGEKRCHNQAFKTLGSLGPDANVICTVYSSPDCVVGSGYGTSKDGLVYPGVKTCVQGNFWNLAPGRTLCPSSWACEVQLVRDASWVGNE